MGIYELYEKTLEYKGTNRGLEYEHEYDKRKENSEEKYKNAEKISKNIKKILGTLDTNAYLSGAAYEENFKKTMHIYGKVVEKWKTKFEQNEDKKEDKNMVIKISKEESTIPGIVDKALNTPCDTFETLDCDSMKAIRLHALMVFYANKVAHECEYLEDSCIKHIISFCGDVKDVEDLDKILSNIQKDGKTSSIYVALRKYYADIAVRNMTEAERKSKENELISKLESYGLPLKSGTIRKGLIGNETLENLVKMEIYAYRIKDYEISNLENELSQQNEILYGISKDSDNRNIFVVDLPLYGQFSVHLKNDYIIKPRECEKYPYEVYNLQNVCLLQSKPSTGTYIQDQLDKGIMMPEDLQEALVYGLDEIGDLHQIAVKLGLSKEEIRKLHEDFANKERDSKEDDNKGDSKANDNKGNSKANDNKGNSKANGNKGDSKANDNIEDSKKNDNIGGEFDED